MSFLKKVFLLFSLLIAVNLEAVTYITTQTWSTAHTVSGDVTLRSGNTLTIEAGTIVTFASNARLTIAGHLNVIGISGSEVVFTADAEVPVPGYYQGIFIENGATASVEYAQIRYGGSDASYGSFYKTGAGAVSLNHVTVEDALSYGIEFRSASDATSIVNNAIIQNNGSHGLMIQNSLVTLSNNMIDGNGGHGLYVVGSAIATAVIDNTFSNTVSGKYAVYLISNASGLSVASSNILDTVIYVEAGIIDSDATWTADHRMLLGGDLILQSANTLTIEAGASIEFIADASLSIEGHLDVNGIFGSEVLFTADSTAVPKPGYYRGIHLLDGATALVAYAKIHYAGSDSSTGSFYKTGTGEVLLDYVTVANFLNSGIKFNDASDSSVSNTTIENGGYHGIGIFNSAITLSHNTIQDTQYGVYIYGPGSSNTLLKNNIIRSNVNGIYCTNSASPIIGGQADYGNDIYGNITYGLQNTFSVDVNAAYNWWGALSGPKHNETNAGGQGNAVTDYVLFLPFTSQNIQPIADDLDADGVLDIDDNCPKEPNPGQENRLNNNSFGDVCDPARWLPAIYYLIM